MPTAPKTKTTKTDGPGVPAAAAEDAAIALARSSAETTAPAQKSGRRGTLGVWMHYRHSNAMDIVPVSLHAAEIDARRAAMENAVPSKVVFVPWGALVEDVIS